MNINDNARTVMERRIAAKDDEGKPIESPEQILHRVACFVASGTDNPAKYGPLFYNMMAHLDFLPNSPTLVNAGRENSSGQLSACFVLPIEDSMESIFETLKQTAIIHKSGGGTGFNFSRLRQANAPVRSSNGVASGPVSFMEIYDAATDKVKQGGTRRGANMGILRIDHPDIMEFISVKSDPERLQNFNISVATTDHFMSLLETHPNEKWVGNHTVQQVWDALVNNAWNIGDPGLVFIDRINASRANPVPSLGPIEATNPCGEAPLYPYDSCNLGSINLANFVAFNDIDYVRLEECIRASVVFLDAVITVNQYPLPQIKELSDKIRRIGLGVMGWADMLYKLRIPYDSERALQLANQVMRFVTHTAAAESAHLAAIHGVFPMWDESIYAKDNLYYRNSTRTTIAPTGTLSIIAGCSSGIEPSFALAFKRSHFLDRYDASKRHEMLEVNPVFEKACMNAGIPDHVFNEICERLAAGVPLHEIPGVPADIVTVFRTAHDITPEWHVKMQAAFQKNTDNAVSKTINFPNTATIADVDQAYRLAYALGCMGITIYRDGSRDLQVLSFTTPEVDVDVDVEVVVPHEHHRKHLPNERHSITHKFTVGDFEGYLTVGLWDDGTPGEMFINGSKAGTTISGLLDSFAMSISYALQYGVPVEDLFPKLMDTRFEPAGLTNHPEIHVATSIIDYIARYMLWRFSPTASIDVSTAAVISHSIATFTGMICPDCQSIAVAEEGCLKCYHCGWNRCG